MLAVELMIGKTQYECLPQHALLVTMPNPVCSEQTDFFFYEEQEIGVSAPMLHFRKHPQQEMSLSVWDGGKYPGALTEASKASHVVQQHTLAQRGSILRDKGPVMAPAVQQLSH